MPMFQAIFKDFAQMTIGFHLFFIQLILPWSAVRISFIAIYLLISAYLLFIRRGPASEAFFDLLRGRTRAAQS